MELPYRDAVCKSHWPRLRSVFPSFQLIAYNEVDCRLLAEGNTVPFDWNGGDEDLPDGVPADSPG